jgi:hypothetical protein
VNKIEEKMIGKIDDDLISKFGDIVATELMQSFKDNIDFMSSFCPIGEVIPILVGMPGVPDPDPNIFQECDGSEITNENSPLRSQGGSPRFTPNMIGRYIRVPVNFGLSGNSGGYNTTLQFKHSHGGRTDTVGTGGAIRSGFNKRHARSHSHEIKESFTTPVNVEPRFYTVKFYMRIQ